MPEKQADVIIIGLGAMGTAAAFQCAQRGLRVIGIEQFELGHERGSSHGKSRVIRKAYFEDPRFVPLLHATYDEWREVESQSGQRLLHLVGCLNMGPPAHPAIEGVRASVRQHALAHETLTAGQIRQRWPFFEPAENDIGIFEADGGFIRPEQAMHCLAQLANRHGAMLSAKETVHHWSADGNGVTIETDKGRYTAANLIVSAGSWLPGIVPELAARLEVERQVQAWFMPDRPAAFERANMPVFIHFTEEDGFYGIPPSDSATGIKIARHHGGVITTADTVDRRVHPQDEADIRRYIRKYIPAADGPMVDAKVCLYTNTPDSHFIIDRHPAHENVWIGGGFSGHGFKFAPLVGKILSELVTDGKTSQPIDLFSISRFS
jgi:sarcosine oxidase